MSGEALAHEIIERFSTKDAVLLCQKAKISIRFERWNPSTIGEFDRKTNTITVNLNAKVDQKRIIAHELGHYFVHQKGIKLSRTEEEKVAEDFAKSLFNHQ